MPFEETALRLVVALLLGSAIGVERQFRQRAAGLRTNALVALGAAGFALIGFSLTGEASPSRMAAQVVSGIGFLGAGAIMREGLNVKGLNTAATLWCSAAAGIGCGAGFLGLAVLLAGLVVALNIVVRPLVAAIDRSPQSGAEVERAFRITATGEAAREAALRLLLVKQIALSEARLERLDSADVPGPAGAAPRVVLTARVVLGGAGAAALETIVAAVRHDPGISRIGWAEEAD